MPFKRWFPRMQGRVWVFWSVLEWRIGGCPMVASTGHLGSLEMALGLCSPLRTILLSQCGGCTMVEESTESSLKHFIRGGMRHSHQGTYNSVGHLGVPTSSFKRKKKSHRVSDTQLCHLVYCLIGKCGDTLRGRLGTISKEPPSTAHCRGTLLSPVSTAATELMLLRRS